jgi:hypothetical protein
MGEDQKAPFVELAAEDKQRFIREVCHKHLNICTVSFAVHVCSRLLTAVIVCYCLFTLYRLLLYPPLFMLY